eukprot:c33820_g1_i1 orf=155-310(+)
MVSFKLGIAFFFFRKDHSIKSTPRAQSPRQNTKRKIATEERHHSISLAQGN